MFKPEESYRMITMNCQSVFMNTRFMIYVSFIAGMNLTFFGYFCVIRGNCCSYKFINCVHSSDDRIAFKLAV